MSVGSVTYTAPLEQMWDNTGWHIVRVPSEIKQELSQLGGKKGNIPVIATIRQSSWPTTLMSQGEQQWFFAVKADIRKKEGLLKGDQVEVQLVPDMSRIMSRK